MKSLPGRGEDAAYISFCFLNSLINLLTAKGVITEAEVMTLLEEVASNLSQDARTSADRNARYVRDAMIPEHKIVEREDRHEWNPKDGTASMAAPLRR